MDTTSISSQATSGVLHGLFLLLAFMAPVTNVLEPLPEWLSATSVVRLDRPIVIETGFHHPRTVEQFEETGRGGAPGDGEGDSAGARAVQKVVSDPPRPERKLAANTEIGLVEELGGLLTGFADETIGPDTELALGALDDGGGGNSFGGFGFSGAGRGASCGRVWEELARGVKVVKHEGCKGIPLAGFGTAGYGFAGGRAEPEPEPDLGEKPDTEVRPTVLTGKPVGCLTDAACPWKEIVEKVIKRHKRELEYCYDRSLDREKRGFSAEVDVSFAISPAGGPAGIELASTSGVAAFDTCVRDRTQRWVFPETGLAIRANYPFRFHVL